MTKKLLMPLVATMLGVTSVHAASVTLQMDQVNPDAKRYDTIAIQDVIDQKLGVMDLTASIMCMENKMPMYVFGLNEENSIVKAISGDFTGTKVVV